MHLGVLRKNGVPIRCQEQPLQVLAALAERPGELVTREELRRRVWPEDTFVDFDHALNTAVKKIRAALNDDADAPRYIETVPRRGYRFVAPLTPSAQLPSLDPPAPPLWPATPRRRWLFLAIPIFALAIVGVAWRTLYGRREKVSPPPEFQRLTFAQHEFGEARFTPDGASVVYSVGFGGYSEKAEIYAQRFSAAAPQPLGFAGSTLLAVSPQGELAVLGDISTSTFDDTYNRDTYGTLARAPLGGGAARQLLSGVAGAEWSPDGRLAVVRRVAGRTRLEFPLGKVLYESTGWISSPRFAPRGDAIAFLDHPVDPDDRGSVEIVDLTGARRTLSGFWESVRGLAWNPRGDQVWFTAARSGVGRVLYAVDLRGKQRRVLSVAGGLSLRDISPDGRVLLTRDNQSLGILFMGNGDSQPRDLSWEDWSIAMDISRDGKKILFDEEGEDSGFSYQVGLRPIDGSPPVILGAGVAQALSPDGQWALSVMPPPNDQIVLLPTGAGLPKPLPRGSVERYEFDGANWFPDGKHIAFVGYEGRRGPRCYWQSTEGGDPSAFTAEGMIYCSVSPTGRVLAVTEDRRAFLYDSPSSQQPAREFKLAEGELPSGWTTDGKFLYLTERRQKPVSIDRLDLATGRRLPWKVISAAPPSAEMKAEAAIVTPDGRSYAYTYYHHASDLYLVRGLK